MNPCPISHISQINSPIFHLLLSRKCWFLRLLPSLNLCPISHISQITIPISHSLLSRNFWLLRLLLSPLTQSPIYQKITRSIYHPLLSQNFLFLILVLSPFPNILSITNHQPNIPSPVISKLLIVETEYITLYQYPIYHKFPDQYPIPCDHNISNFWDCFLVCKYVRRRITLILTVILLVWYTHICQGKGL